MSHLNILINQVENEWLEILYDNIKSIYCNKYMPSHNEDHHLRVWRYSLSLLRELDKIGIIVEKRDIVNLIIAVFFHDIGMVSTPGPDHGITGKLMCEKWLDSQSLSGSFEKEMILSAIQLHDDKTYISQSTLEKNGRIDISGILGLSDDLDAFGHVGIFRYMEIYLLRGTAIKDLGKLILINVCNRYENFIKQCKAHPALIKLHSPRYEITRSFYMQYNEQMTDKFSEKKNNQGPYPIVRFVNEQIHEGEYSIIELCEKGMSQFKNSGGEKFFRQLQNEWRIQENES